MIFSQRISTFFIICVLSCLLVLSIAAPKLWEDAVPHVSTREPLLVEPIVDAREVPNPVPTERKTEPTETPARKGEPIVLRPVSDPSPKAAEVSAPPLQGDLSPVAKSDSADAQPKDVVAIAEPIEVEGPTMVVPEGKIGASTVEATEEESKASTNDASETPQKQVHRLPIIVANIPSREPTLPREEFRAPDYPSTDNASASNDPQTISRKKAEHNVDDSWKDPETLLEDLRELAAIEATSRWAKETIAQITALGAAMGKDADQSSAALKRLENLRDQTPQLAVKISDKNAVRKLKKAGYSLGRRMDVWQQMLQLDKPIADSAETVEMDPNQLALCLAKVDLLTADSKEGRAWRDFLLVDALKESAKRNPSFDDRQTQQIAQQVLERLAQTPLTPKQQTFVTTGPVAAWRKELRYWAAEPVGAASVLQAIEEYERTCLPSNAQRLAKDCQNLTLSLSPERRDLAKRVDLHYRNANFRLALSEELINKLIPERNLEYALVADTVQGLPVRGESLMSTEVSVRMSPDPRHVRVVLEVKGEISSATTADAGAARFHNDSESFYVARKPMQIDMDGVSVWPSEVGVENNTDLRGVDTPFDWIPLVGASARWMAKTASEQSKSAASQEVKQKIAAQARARIDTEARERLTEFVDRMNQRVFDPLNSLALDPQLIEAVTDEKRFTMRLRLAGEDQLGSHTPRPQAPSDSLASVQLHESVLNNGIQRLQLNGRKFTLGELSQHIADRLSRPNAWEINPEHADVAITFAEQDAVIVRCQNDQIVLTLSIADLSKGNKHWRNFKIRALYRPEVSGRSAQLVREGVIQLIGDRLNFSSQVVLRGIFARALSKNNVWDLVPAKIANEPKLADAAITQFLIDDGWIGVALGPKREINTVRRPQRSVK